MAETAIRQHCSFFAWPGNDDDEDDGIDEEDDDDEGDDHDEDDDDAGRLTRAREWRLRLGN